jgi:hypothetical protein
MPRSCIARSRLGRSQSTRPRVLGQSPATVALRLNYCQRHHCRPLDRNALYTRQIRGSHHMKCGICGQELNVPLKPETGDCGGDCLKCMADFDDPECVEILRRLNDPRTRAQEIERYEADRVRQVP